MSSISVKPARANKEEFELTLLLCPFCGGKPQTAHARAYVYCERAGCGANGRLFKVAEWQRNPARARSSL